MPDGISGLCYDGAMRCILLFALFCLAPFSSTFAYMVTVTEIDSPYENIDIGVYQGEEKVLLGELIGYPVMYQFVVEEPEVVTMRVRQAYRPGVEPDPLALLLVSVDAGGGSVTELGRVRSVGEQWSIIEDAQLGMAFLENEVFERELTEGTYRIEVSTPTNEGRYALILGDGEGDAGYFGTVANIRTTQKHFGYSVFRMLASPYVFYPLGILVLAFLFQRTWKYRNLIRNVE